jgi:hypothetical protein
VDVHHIGIQTAQLGQRRPAVPRADTDGGSEGVPGFPFQVVGVPGDHGDIVPGGTKRLRLVHHGNVFTTGLA